MKKQYSIEELMRRKRMLIAHLKLPSLRPARRKKMERQLREIEAILVAISNAAQKAKAEAQKPPTPQVKLEDASPELKELADEAERVHLAGMLPSVFGGKIIKEEEEKEDV